MTSKITLLFSMLFFTVCANAQIRYLKGTLQASQEGPGVSSPGGGVVIVKYNTTTRLLEHYGNYRALTANITNQHIHTGAPGVVGPVTINLTATGGTAGGLTGSQVLTVTQEAALLAGNMYTNVHTSTYTGGEIRAQLTLATDGQTEFLNARLQGAQQFPPNGSLAMGSVNALIDKSTHMLYLTGTYSGLTTAAIDAHIHRGAPHVSGPVIIPVKFATSTTGSLDTSRMITIADETDILNGNTYVNVHSSAPYTAGEIRGQLTMLSQRRFLANALQSSQEVPPVVSSARGTVIVKYNTTTNLLELTGDYQNLSASIAASHIHGPFGPQGMLAPVLFNLANTGGTTGTLTGTVTIAENDEANLLAGNMYVNVHSTNFPDGEIRAQLLPTSVFDSHYFMDTLQFSQSFPTPPVPSTGTGNSVILLDKLTRMVYVTGKFSGLTSNITMTHIHGGAAGAMGPVVVPLFFGGTTSGTVTGVGTIARPTFVDSMINGFTYLNIHTMLNGAGEIRGQLGDLVLPVKLVYFNAYREKNQVALIWESAQEINLSRYEIQQQSETGNWLTKTTALAAGGSFTAKYRVYDVPLTTKTDYIYYRLKMLDKDGKFTYSQVIKLNFKQSKPELTILANPVLGNEIKYTITGISSDKKAEISILDITGRSLYNVTTSSLLNNKIQVGNLSKGIYKLVVRIEGQLMQQTFSK